MRITSKIDHWLGNTWDLSNHYLNQSAKWWFLTISLPVIIWAELSQITHIIGLHTTFLIPVTNLSALQTVAWILAIPVVYTIITFIPFLFIVYIIVRTIVYIYKETISEFLSWFK